MPSATLALNFALGIILLIACYTDIRTHRISNQLCLAGILLGLSLNVLINEFSGLTHSLAGLFTGFGLMFPFYLGGGMAAGDVKLMAVVGSFLGAATTLWAVLFTLVCGAAMAALILLIRGSLMSTLKRFATTLKLFVFSRQVIHVNATGDDPAAMRFPYAVAILFGTALSGVFDMNQII